jgi:hypothetical protein
MQLSTRTKDYVVDALALRHCIGPALTPVFTDPAIVKVGQRSSMECLPQGVKMLFLWVKFKCLLVGKGLPGFSVECLLQVTNVHFVGNS